MPIDEFGRQVPSGVGAGDGAMMGPPSSSALPELSGSRRYTHANAHPHEDHRRRRSVSGSPPPAGTSSSRSRSNTVSSLEAGGGGGAGHERSHRGSGRGRHPRSMSHDYPHNDARHEERRSGHGHRRRSYSPPTAPPLLNDRDHNASSHRDHHRDHVYTATKNRSLFFSHPVSRYTDTPMLCQVLWDDEQQDNKLDPPRKDDDEDDDRTSKIVATTTTTTATMEPKLDEEVVPVMEERALVTTYDAYRSKYSLNYIRSFFNAHLDDSWFKERYSPLEHKRAVLAERERAKAEALTMRQQALSSLQELGESSSTSICSFVVQARLGVGVKPTKASETHHHTHQQQHQQHRVVKRKYNSTDAAPELDMLDQRDDDNPLPRTHLHACVHADTTLRILDIPPHVTDQQIRSSLMEHSPSSSSSTAVKLYSATIGGATTASSRDLLDRDAWAIFANKEAKELFLDHLNTANQEANRHLTTTSSRGVNNPSSSNHPTKAKLPKTLELDVDCSDPFGRTDLDDDGKGGAPPALLSADDTEEATTTGATGTTSLAEGGVPSGTVPTVPTRRCTVFVSTIPPVLSQPVSVLTASVSSVERIERDKDASVKMARSLDVARGIPEGSQLDDLLQLVLPSTTTNSTSSPSKEEDALDVTIAYLRRVHLFSFYNGCTSATHVGNVLSGHHAAGTIHLRLKGADDFLRKAMEETDTIYGDLDHGGGADQNIKSEPTIQKDGEQTQKMVVEEAKDLLVIRLDDSIAKALDETEAMATQGGSELVVVDPETDAIATEMEVLEAKSKAEWVENHTTVDDDNRARCAFHFCRKLFKDVSFLKKHLMKKHGEFLRAEVAKCHDSFMMASWDKEPNRPVPPVFVDCGTVMGLVPSIVTGAECPMAKDPEPDLWKERQRQEDEMLLMRQRQDSDRMMRGGDHNSGGGGGQHHSKRDRDEFENNGPRRNTSTFVDVDDMKDEKVELSFANVDVPVPPKKKKKKKKKLL